MLKTRILSALVMAPPTLAAVWYGGWAFDVLVALVAVLMAWEWERMVAGRFGPAGIVTGAVGVGAAFLAGAQPLLALLLAAAALVAVAVISRTRNSAAAPWQVAGVPYILLPVIALTWLRHAPDGRAIIIWLLLVVWATDIGAYAFGRAIGGPKLAPRLSPKKTWAGLGGGVLCAGLVGWGCGASSGFDQPLALAAVSAAMAIAAQAGDIAESAVKRRFGVKDSSNIIPGHGGVLDRVDGVLPVAALVALVYVL